MGIKLSLPDHTGFKPRILVIGVGGAGGNAVNNMISSDSIDVDFVVANTDSQVLGLSLCQERLQLGARLTKGLGAGADPEIGRKAAEEDIDKLAELLDGYNICFITAGMGGGTGTGASPIIAAKAQELGVLTVGVVTKPFNFEGVKRKSVAEDGIKKLRDYVDTLIVVPNQNLFRIADEKTTFAEAFAMADNVLCSGVKGITDLMLVPGLINLDFADLCTVMKGRGRAVMGTGYAEGPDRACAAAEAAITNPILDDISLSGATAIIVNITGGSDMTLYEVNEATCKVRDQADPDAEIIVGSTFNEIFKEKICVSIVATGLPSDKLKYEAIQIETGVTEPGGVSRAVDAATPVGERSAKSDGDSGVVGAVRWLLGYDKKKVVQSGEKSVDQDKDTKVSYLPPVTSNS